MDVGLDNMAHVDVPSGEELEHAIDVPLRVNDHGLGAGDDCVASIAQLWGLDGEDLRGHVRTIPHA